MPLRITCTRSACSAGYVASTSDRIPPDTAITAAADSTATRSHHDDTAYPPPSCSDFHGRNGSSECTVITCGVPYMVAARWPARFVYQVCECTTSAEATAAAIDRSVETVCRAALASASKSHGRCATASGRSAPWQCTVRLTRSRSSLARYSTCTPAPPYTSGGYSLVSMATLTLLNGVVTG